MTVDQLVNIAEQYNFTFHEYKENDVLCGYEMEAWTDGGVNMIHFINCRDVFYPAGLTPYNVLSELEKISAYFDVDDEIDLHRQGNSYRKAFTIRESLEDFEEYQERLKQLVLVIRAVLSAEDSE